MASETVVEKMITRPIYNLEFPSRCPELNILGYRFLRVSNYHEKLLSLQHLATMHSEFSVQANTGGHAITSIVEFMEKEESSALEWPGSDTSALMDILLLLSIFTGRDVFAERTPNRAIKDNEDANVIIADPRVYQWGGILRCSIPYKNQQTLFRLNKRLPREKRETKVMQRTGDLHDGISSADDVESANIFDNATAFETAVDMFNADTQSGELSIKGFLRRG